MNIVKREGGGFSSSLVEKKNTIKYGNLLKAISACRRGAHFSKVNFFEFIPHTDLNDFMMRKAMSRRCLLPRYSSPLIASDMEAMLM